MVHRPRYKDWSWPKGKLDPRETYPAAAAREVAEEIGDAVVLGVPLPSLQYTTSDGKRGLVRTRNRVVRQDGETSLDIEPFSLYRFK